MRRIEILVDSNVLAEKLVSFLTSPAVTEMLAEAGGKIEGVANLDADSLGGFDPESNVLETVEQILENEADLPEESHYLEDDRNAGGNFNG